MTHRATPISVSVAQGHTPANAVKATTGGWSTGSAVCLSFPLRYTRNIIESGVYEVGMSDHYMVYCIRKFNGAVERDHKIIKTRKMKNFN